MAITGDTIRDMAKLSRLRVSDDHLDDMTARFAATLALFDAQRAVPTDGVEPMAHPLDAVQPLRADAVTASDRRSELQAVAPLVEDGHYLVPRVVE